MTLCCGCDMPIEIYADWLQDQGWETDELRVEEEPLLTYYWYIYGNGYERGSGIGIGRGYGNGAGSGYGYISGCGIGYDPIDTGDAQ